MGISVMTYEAAEKMAKANNAEIVINRNGTGLTVNDKDISDEIKSIIEDSKSELRELQNELELEQDDDMYELESALDNIRDLADDLIDELSALPELQEKLLVKVIDLYKEESFEKLFKKVFVGEDKEKIIEKAKSMNRFYTPEQEKEYGVVGIKIEIIK